MGEFFSALAEQGFLQRALMGGLLACVGCGVVGAFVVVKRISYVAGGVAHAALGGMGAAYFFGAAPLWGALGAAVVAALVIGLASLRFADREDTLISALWAVGMATGVMFIAKTPGYSTDLMSYLFGAILMVTDADLLLMAILDGTILLLTGVFYKQLLAIAFDEEFARIRGLPVEGLTLLLYLMVALTVTLLIKVVGLVLVIALLTLPAAIAGQYVRSLGRMMIVAVLLGGVFVAVGLALSYAPDLPAGATIILLAGFAYLLSTALAGLVARR
jgi:zinc transport system permease protein